VAKPESNSSKRKIRGADVEAIALEMRYSEASFQTIANALAEKFGRSYTESGARKAVNRALARVRAEVDEKAEALKRRMIARAKGIVMSHYPKARRGGDGSEAAADMVLKADKRLCELEGIRLFNPQQLEHGGPDGGPIPMGDLSPASWFKALEAMGNGQGPPEQGFVDRTGDEGNEDGGE